MNRLSLQGKLTFLILLILVGGLLFLLLKAQIKIKNLSENSELINSAYFEEKTVIRSLHLIQNIFYLKRDKIKNSTYDELSIKMDKLQRKMLVSTPRCDSSAKEIQKFRENIKKFKKEIDLLNDEINQFE